MPNFVGKITGGAGIRCITFRAGKFFFTFFQIVAFLYISKTFISVLKNVVVYVELDDVLTGHRLPVYDS